MKKFYSKMKKALLLASVMMFGMLLFTGCTSPMEYAAQNHAKEYIKEKYGIEAKVVNSKEERTDSAIGGTTTGRYLIEMEYEGVRFRILTGSTSEYPAYDNYQAEEIAEAYLSDIVKCIGKEPYYYNLACDDNTYNKYDREYDNYFTTYYDGSNLYQVLSESSNCKINLVYTDGTNVSNADLMPVADRFQELLTDRNYFCAYLNLYSFSNVEDFEEAKELCTGNHSYIFPRQLMADMPKLADAQLINYKFKENGRNRIYYINTEQGYEYSQEDDSYRYFPTEEE